MITLYTIDCPKCKILEKKLNQAEIKYEKCTDISIMQQKGLDFLPVLEINDKIMDFKKAVIWLNERG